MIQSKRFSLHLIEPGIIKLSVINGIELEQEDAKQMIIGAMEMAGEGEYTILFDANKEGTISHEAREEFARSKKRKAVAIVTKKLANRLVGNFFINFHKPKSPSRIFRDEKSALEWLRGELRKR